MSELIIFTGLQASGKSYFYNLIMKDEYLRINLDMLKTRKREWIIFIAGLKSKTKMVIDNTNPTILDRKKYIDEAKKHKYDIIGMYFTTSVNECIKRNIKRDNPVPDVAIYATNKQISIPSINEGFDKVVAVELLDGEYNCDTL